MRIELCTLLVAFAGLLPLVADEERDTLTGGFEVGYRDVSVAGNEDKYREDVYLDDPSHYNSLIYGEHLKALPLLLGNREGGLLAPRIAALMRKFSNGPELSLSNPYRNSVPGFPVIQELPQVLVLTLQNSRVEGGLAMLKQSFLWFLLACELAAIVLLLLGIMDKLKLIFQRQ